MAQLTALLCAAFLIAGVPDAGAASLSGKVTTGDRPLPGLKVKLIQTRLGARRVETMGSDLTDERGRFRISHSRPAAGAQLYVTAGTRPAVVNIDRPKGSQASFDEPRRRPRGTVLLGAFLGAAPFGGTITVNERTTVAAGFALAQFARDSRITGPAPGLPNAGLMAANLANVRTGAVSKVLTSSPNGNETETLSTFNSLANTLTPCVRHPKENCGELFRTARVPGEAEPRGVLDALAMIARNPWHNVAALFQMTLAGPAPYGPALPATDPPSAWTLALRFDGDGHTMNGPGNFAIDAKGSLWVVNNYNYSPDPFQSVCGSDLLLRFTPDGRYYPGSPYTGGGVSGAGFGVALDPAGKIWVGNYGFAAKGCEIQPPHNSVSKFQPNGTPISPDTGYTAGDISWPQGTVSDRGGNIWIANCGNDTVTYYPDGRPAGAKNLSDLGLTEPFGVATGKNGRAFVTGIGSDAVAVLNRGATPAPGSPTTGGGLDQPMGISTDFKGNLWVANSGLISLPCPTANVSLATRGGSLTLLDPQGRPKRKTSFKGGGLTIPWGNAVDGNNTVWVANFAHQRVSQFCGTTVSRCPKGKSTGDPISPNGTGYGFDGLTRNTGVAIDPSGNVWITNNWKLKPVQTNPGGYQVVAMVGAAGPVKTPLIGLPARP